MSDTSKIHEDTDFIVSYAGVTTSGEFVYTHGGRVQPGLTYHIHYTNEKDEVFMTGGSHIQSSKIIEKVSGTDSLFKSYTKISSAQKTKYPEGILTFPSDSDYRIGSFTRYFTQLANNSSADIFEISSEDNDQQNNLFRYINFKWRISGTKNEVTRDNQRTMDSINSDFVGIIRKLFPLQLWKPPKNSPDSLQKKLVLLRSS